MGHLCFSVLYLLCLRARLFICVLWSPAWKGLTSWLSFVVCHLPIGILGQVWYLIVSISDTCYKLEFSLQKNENARTKIRFQNNFDKNNAN